MTTPTSNPIPSGSPRDLLFNAEKIDEAVNTGALTYVDRFGVTRLTLAGAAAQFSHANNRGAWSTGTAYAVNDLVLVSGSWWVCFSAHTSGATFAADQVARWHVYQGASTQQLDAHEANVTNPHATTKAQVGLGNADNTADALKPVSASQKALIRRSVETASRPAFLEQHVTGFFGRGMLTAETINIVTEQDIVGTFPVGSATVVVTDATSLLQGACISIRHDNGMYGTYFISAKSGATLTIAPKLRYGCTTGARVERTWFNRAHPGKFYMRELAQRIARATESDAAMPDGGRLLFTRFATSSAEDTLTALGSAAVSYFSATNTGSSGSVSTPVRFGPGRTAYVETIAAVGAGAETKYFASNGTARAQLSIYFAQNPTANSYTIKVLDDVGTVLGSKVVPGPPTQPVLQLYSFAVDLRSVKRFKVTVTCTTYAASGGYFVIGAIDVFASHGAHGKVVANASGTVVCLGDSWVAGDAHTERESICTQLAIELPYATVVNAGVGGNTLLNMLARFDTDVAPHSPDCVVVNTGTNESYNPFSVTFDPNAVASFLDQYRILLAKIAALGARAIVIGVPALAQSDADVPAFAEWLLNDRAKAYSGAFAEWMAKAPAAYTGGDVFSELPTAAPVLTKNGQMSAWLQSDTSLRIVVRGSDGVTRTATLTLS